MAFQRSSQSTWSVCVRVCFNCLLFTMNLVQEQRVLSRFTFALFAIGMFAKMASSASVDFVTTDNLIALDDENPKYEVFIKAANLSGSLASRYHNRFATVYDAFRTEDQLAGEIDDLFRDRVEYVKRLRNEYKRSLEERFQSTSEYTAINAAAINTIVGRTLRNGENSTDQLRSQMVRHQMTTPLKVLQSLLSFSIAQHQQTTGLDAKVAADLVAHNKTQPLEHIIELFKYKPRVMKEVLHDLDSILRQQSVPFFTLKRAIETMLRKINEALASDKIPTAESMKSLSDEWKNLQSIINKSTPEDGGDIGEILGKMNNLTECAQLGIAVYRECRNTPRKLREYSIEVSKFGSELEKWRKHEQTTYEIIIPVLAKIEKSLANEPRKNIDFLILPILPKLDILLYQMQQNPMYSNEFNRMLGNIKPLIRMVKSLLHLFQVYTDRTTLVAYIEQIQQIGPGIPAQTKTVDGIITANLMLEMCRMTREVLKLRVFPFDQDYMELCNMPKITDKSKAKEYVKQHLLKNVATLQAKIAYAKKWDRPQNKVTWTLPITSHPALEWKSTDFKNDIAKLLKGEKIILTADSSAEPYNSMKISQIVLDFNFANKDRQREFYQAIKGFVISMKMIGDNYFACNGRLFYVPTDANLHFQYFVGQMGINDIENAVASGNELYVNVMKRDPYLSVLSTWELQLHNPDAVAGKPQDFIGDEIDLQFKGVFKYVWNKGVGAQACDNKELAKNYKFEGFW